MKKLKQELEDLIKYNIDSYDHDDWVTTYEGESICRFIIKLIDHIETLEQKVKQLENYNSRFILLK